MKILKNFLKNNDSKPTPLQKTVETVQSVIEETDSEKEIARKKAIDVAVKEIQENKDMPAGKFMQMLQEKTSLTDEDLVTIITQLPDVKSEKATIAAVQSTSLSPENITSIVKEADISLDTAEKIVNEIDNIVNIAPFSFTVENSDLNELLNFAVCSREKRRAMPRSAQRRRILPSWSIIMKK